MTYEGAHLDRRQQHRRPPGLGRRRALPVDTVAPQHADIDADLDRWGRWSVDRGYRPGSCRSIESEYRRSNGNNEIGWEYDPPKALSAGGPDLRSIEINRAMLSVPAQHREALKMHYVERRRPEEICRAIALQFDAFGRWMFDARCMVLNNLRQAGV